MTAALCVGGGLVVVLLFVEFVIVRPRDCMFASTEVHRMLAEKLKRGASEEKNS